MSPNDPEWKSSDQFSLRRGEYTSGTVALAHRFKTFWRTLPVFQQVFLAFGCLCNLGRDVPPSRLTTVLFGQVLLDQIPHIGEGRKLHDGGDVNGRGNGRNQSGRDTVQSYTTYKRG
jgi:hypothetical protein